MSKDNAIVQNTENSEVDFFELGKIMDGLNLFFTIRNIHRKLHGLASQLKTEFPEILKEEIELLEELAFAFLQEDKSDDRIYDLYCEYLETDMSEMDFVSKMKGWEED